MSLKRNFCYILYCKKMNYLYNKENYLYQTSIMYNFFQSQIRKDIKTIIYNEEHFTITLFDKEYF